MDNSKIFGNLPTFAIVYRPGLTRVEDNGETKYAFCHLGVDNTIIGNPDEVCYLPTWISCLSANRDFISSNRDDLFPKEFHGFSDREIFEILLKTNQFEDEFSPEFSYLPQIDTLFWHRHHFTLDETIDSYLLFFYVKDNLINFLIEDRTETRQTDNRSNKFIFKELNHDLFLIAIDETKKFLVQTYPNLKRSMLI